MAKQTLMQKEAAKEKKIPNRILWDFLTKIVIKHFLSPKYNPEFKVVDDINECKTGCFLIYNHQSRNDWIYSTQLCYPRRINFMVGYNEFFRSHLHAMLGMLNAIPKKNFTIDMVAIKNVGKIIKQGGCVCMAPEGMSSITGHNQPIGEGTGKLFKHYKVPVYFMRLEGAFLTNNKVCLDERKGKVYATLTKLFTPEDLERMSPEEIDMKTDEALWQDEFEWNKEKQIAYESHGEIAKHQHDICYKCPKCGSEFQMVGEGMKLYCKKCGNGALMDDKYNLNPLNGDDVLPHTISEWVYKEQQDVIDEIRKDPNYSFSFKCKLGVLNKYKLMKNMKTSEVVGEGTFTIDHDGCRYEGTRDGKPYTMDLSYKVYPTIGMPTDVTYFAGYYQGEYFDIYPDEPVVGKVWLLIGEMHRLHVNSWKNFPWFDHMYKQYGGAKQ